MKIRLFQKLRSLFAAFFMLLMVNEPAAGGMEGDNWWLGGRINQGFSWAYDLPGQDTETGPSQFLLELEGAWEPSSSVLVTADLWLRGDWFNQFSDGGIIQGGIQDFTAGPPFLGQFQHNLSRAGTGFLPQPFGADDDQTELLDDFDNEILREFAIRYADPKGRFGFKVGKFQRGWGQADGLRVLDVLYAQDLRQRSVLKDTEEVRIPAWSVALDLNFTEMGIAGPFEAIGLSRPTLEMILIPEVRHSEFVINNPTPGNSTSGGIFGFPFPLLSDPVSGFGLPFIGANLSANETDEFGLSKAEFGARLKFHAMGAEWTINGFYGRQDLPVVKLLGSELLIGTPLNDPAQALAVVPLPLPITIGAVHGPGGYLDFLRSVAGGTAMPGQFPLLAFGCNDILVAMPNCSINANFELDFDYPHKIAGFSFTRDMREWKLGRKNVSPVIRAEMAFEFDKPFNRGLITTPFGKLESGSPALLTDPMTGIVERDVWTTMLGVDYFLWLPFWKSQRQSILTTFQFFNVRTRDSSGLLQQAPYGSALVHRNQKYVTFTWNMGLLQEKLVLDGLLVADLSNDGEIYRQRVDYIMMQNALRARLEWVHFSGEREAGPAGLLQNSDYLEFSLNYQF